MGSEIKTTTDRIVTVACLLVMVAAGCGDSASSDDAPPGGNGGNGGDEIPADSTFPATGETTYDVEYKSGAVVLGDDQMSEVREVVGDQNVYSINSTTEGASEIREGDAILLWDHGVRRVQSRTEENGRIVVETEPGAVTDVIENGTIAWNEDLNFGLESVAGVGVDGQMMELNTSSDAGQPVFPTSGDSNDNIVNIDESEGSVEFAYEAGTYDYKLKVVMRDTSAKVTIILAHKDEQSLVFRIEGTLEGFESAGHTRISGGETKEFSYKSSNWKGNLEITAIAAGDGATSFEFPMPDLMFKIPIPQLPGTYIGAGTQLKGKLGIPSEATAQINSSFSYSGDFGIQYDGTDTDFSANIAGQDFSPSKIDSSANLNVPVNLSMGIALPKVSVSFFGDSVVTDFLNAFILDSRLVWGPICKYGRLEYEAKAKFTASVLGLYDLAEADKSFYKDERYLNTDSKNCRKHDLEN